MQHRDKIILNKVISEIKIGLDLLGETTFEEFKENELLKRAICMTVVNIGELVKSLSDETRTEYPKILWKDIAGMRDVTAHKYQTLKMEDVYNTVKYDFSNLCKQLEEIVEVGR